VTVSSVPWRSRLFETALEVPRWAWAFYRRHFLLVAGISLVPASQRMVWALWSNRMPPALNVVLELLTAAARLLLVVLIARRTFAGGRDASRTPSPRRGTWAFLRERWLSLALQVGMLGVLAAVFDLVPDRVVAPLIPTDLQRLYWAALLGLKNPTVIAFTLVWLVGAVRQATSYPLPLTAPARPARPAS
jgi:hypothetical protein